MWRVEEVAFCTAHEQVGTGRARAYFNSHALPLFPAF
jgi:hypothetical protein